jgi:hypothetical protein
MSVFFGGPVLLQKYNALYFALPDTSLRSGQAGQSARPTGSVSPFQL